MRKRRPMARALSLLLSLILALSLLPGAALAAETDNSRVYSPEEVDSVLGQAVRGGALTDENKAYDLNGDGKLTTWDAKKMLDALTPELARAIRFKAMRIIQRDKDKGTDASTDWVDVTIQDGKVSKTTVLNHFIGTLNELHDKRYPNYTFYPEAGALCGGKLMLQVAYYNNGTVAASDLVPVDPDSFAAPAMNAVDASDWHDITALSDGRMLTVSSVQQTLLSLWQDGKRMADGNLEQSALGGSVLVGIASAGKDNSGAEVLYGLAKDGKLYRFSLTVDGMDTLVLTTPVQIGESNVIPGWYETKSGDPNTPYYTWEIDSASLLATNGYLLAAVTYFSMALVKYQSVVFVIDPAKGSCVKVALDDGVVLNSLYQYKQEEDAAGVQLYVETDAITLRAGTSVDLPAAEAYTFSTDENGLVTNSKVDDSAVEWSSSNTNVVSIDTETGKITAADVTEKTTATLTAVATANGQTVTKTVTVTVNPATGMKVGAMINTSGGDVWAEIELDERNGDSFKDIKVNGTLEKGVTYTGVGYARGKLWGVCNYALYSFSFDPEKGYVGKLFDKPKNTSNSVVDLTGAPAIAVEYTTDVGTRTVTEEPAPLVYVTYSGLLGLLGGTIYRDDIEKGSVVSDSGYELAAITYVGDLTVGQVRKGTNNPDLSNCSDDTLCHVYYALTEDDTTNGATLRQLILVPQVDMKDNTPTLSYTLRGSTIGTVTFTDNTSTTSMDFWTDGGSYGLLVARSKAFEGHSIWYIDLCSKEGLTAALKGKVSSVTVEGDSKSVNGISGLYHTGKDTMTANQILAAAGWPPTSQSLAEVTLEASLKAVSAEGSGNAATVEVPVKASADATNGLWTLTYDSTKLALLKVAVNSDILYSDYYDDEAGTLTVGFANRTALSSGKDRPLFTAAFTKLDASASASDVTVEQVELNDPNGGSGDNTGDNTGGNTGGNSGTVTPSKPETLPFTDVEEGSYCYDAVRWAVEKGVTEGVSETSFAPNDPCTRGQAVTFLWRAAGSPAPESQEMPFTDVAESSPYAKAILWAAENGVTKGVTETTFAPNQPCTRGQIVTFLYRSQGAPAQAGSNPFTDVAEESPYLAGILWAAENGVTKGVTETTFAPNNTCVRGQIVTFLYRLWT